LKRLVAEFLVIVTGVLVALGVDQWRDDREDDALEVAYAGRLLSDLRVDTAQYGGMLRDRWSVKGDVLLGLFQGRLPEAEDAEEMVAALDVSGWVGIIAAQTAAFREMESSGRLGLLWNPHTREALASYYARHEFLSGILDSSPSGYRLLVYEAIPGAARYAYHSGQDIDGSMVSAGARALLNDPRMAPAVNAELAYLGELVQRYEGLRDQAISLIHQLESDYPAEGSF
jgi:hypothetical protein